MNIFWFRRDLRLKDNTALNNALKAKGKTLAVFIFDDEIIKELPKNDARISFIYDELNKINKELSKHNSGIKILKGDVISSFKSLIKDYEINSVFYNEDYEPYAVKRDKEVSKLLENNNINSFSYKDQVIFKPGEVLKNDGKAYTVFTPYKNKWLQKFKENNIKIETKNPDSGKLLDYQQAFPNLNDLGFEKSNIKVKKPDFSLIDNYSETRDIPAKDSTSYLGPHLRFGTISIREIVDKYQNYSVFLSELIWREFFMQILFYYPDVVNHNFKRKYDGVIWRNNEKEFELWKKGETGYTMVDAAMKQLNKSGYMHNRCRMIAASFLCKHLLIDWRWGEAYFAEKLLDYELASNNGNWQWAAGTGCDAAPYFRIFNPYTQQKKFDKDFEYVKKWIPDYNPISYIPEIANHKLARERALKTYKEAL